MSDPKGSKPVESMDDREVDLGILWKATLALVAIAVAIHVGLLFLGGFFQAQEQQAERRPTALELAGRHEPPEPRLQPSGSLDLAALRAEEDRRLSAHEWTSPARTSARIPIERAMEIVAGRGVAPLAAMPAEAGSAVPAPTASTAVPVAPSTATAHGGAK